MRLLDPDSCIESMRDPRSRISRKLATFAPSEIFLCSVVKSELTYGAYRSRDVAKSLAILDEFCRPMVSLPFDDLSAVEAARIRVKLASAGTPIGSNDLPMAAIA